MRIVLHGVSILRLNNRRDDDLPGNPGQIGKGALAADEPPVPVCGHLLAGQMAFQHAGHAIDLFDVALDRAGDLFMVEFLEPGRLAVVRALAAGLEKQPLRREGGEVGARREADPVVGIVVAHEVLDDGAGFPQREVGVGIVDGGDAPVGIDGDIVGLLDLGERHLDDLVRKIQFGEDDGHARGIGAALAVDCDGLDVRHVCLGVCLGLVGTKMRNVSCTG